ncbi:Lysosomal acid phosphatase [Amphibalanus amphitrite]|uniref:acid phosphatase n=1 Tax=Amphibalanus amphitrite TaxID=1232801 RepID=A0A6A4WML1_AMPAM|nr:lysosomal acid phosphatase-like [Amphibalanus amphitrite]KAF0307303.1 Lysosomal acid phosphatase [Amphibalanus amphitrite]
MKTPTPALLAAVLLPLAAAAAPDTLRLVNVVYRHGTRTPIEAYPTDPNIGAWPQGDGQLTNEGKQNQLELGRFLRSRYDGFLPELYHMNYTHIEAADVDRCLMSAQANLAGLFPPRGQDVWDAELAWQPIPVHTVPFEDDYKFKSYKICDAYNAEHDRVYSSPQVEAVNAEYAGLYQYLTENSGDLVADVTHVQYLYDTLRIESTHNLTTPEWALAVPPGYDAPAFPDLMEPLGNLDFALLGATPLQRRLGGGTLLKDILKNMKASVYGYLSPPNRKLFAYSGHDTNVGCLLTTLMVYNGVMPPLASAVLVELHAEPEVGATVQLFYRNDTTAEPYPLQLPGCQLSCPWDTFVQLTEDVVPDDIEAECAAVPEGYVPRANKWRRD